MPDVNARQAIIRNAARLAGQWSDLALPARRAILRRLVARIEVRREVVEPAFDPVQPHLCEDEATISLSIPARLKRTGMEIRLLIEGTGGRPWRGRQRFNTMIMGGEDKTIAELASEAGVTVSYFTRILRLSFLAPQIVSAILNDRHPLELSARHLSIGSKLPNSWSDQMRLLGIA